VEEIGDASTVAVVVSEANCTLQLEFTLMFHRFGVMLCSEIVIVVLRTRNDSKLNAVYQSQNLWDNNLK
jgi:hypothetical protein